MADAPACSTLDVGKEWASVPVWRSKAALTTSLRMRAIIAMAVVIPGSPILLFPRGAAAGAVTVTIVAILKSGTGAFRTTNAVDTRGSLDKVVGAVEASYAGGNNVVHAGLGVLVNTSSTRPCSRRCGGR
jgi:hypothetical protein